MGEISKFSVFKIKLRLPPERTKERDTEIILIHLMFHLRDWL